MFFGTSVRVLGIVSISSQSFIVGIVLRLLFSFPYSMRNVLTNFQNFSQPDLVNWMSQFYDFYRGSLISV